MPLSAPLHLPPVYPIVDTATLDRRGGDAAVFTAALLEGGARIVQFRHKGFYSRAVFATAQKIGELCRDAGALFIINDRPDLARLLDAGCHVGQDDLAPPDARAVLGPRLLGLSTHNEPQLRAASSAPVDYLALGPVFVTASKEHADPALGVDEWARLRPLSPKPLVAIGGITRANAAAVWRAGADSIAVISDLYPEDLTLRAVRERMNEWLHLARPQIPAS
jgi:thiamine-phosphate pyrophosphorylase